MKEYIQNLHKKAKNHLLKVKEYFLGSYFLSKFLVIKAWSHTSLPERLLDGSPVYGIRSLLKCIKEDDTTFFEENLSFRLNEENPDPRTLEVLLLSILKYKAWKCFCSIDSHFLNQLNFNQQMTTEMIISAMNELPAEDLSKILQHKTPGLLLFPDYHSYAYGKVTGFTHNFNHKMAPLHWKLMVKLLPLTSPELKFHKEWLKLGSFPFDQAANFLCSYLVQTQDLESLRDNLNHITQTHPFKSQEILGKFYGFLLENYPESVLLKEITCKDLLPVWGTDFNLKKFEAKTWDEVYPFVKNRSLKREILPKLFHKKELFYRGRSDGFTRTFYFEFLWGIINKALENPSVEAQWFLKIDMKHFANSSSFFNRDDASNNFLELLNLLSPRGPKFLKTVVESFGQDSYGLLINDTLRTIRRYNVADPASFAPTVESLKNYHDQLHEVFVDNSTADLDQQAILPLDNQTVEVFGQSYKVVVPKMAKELGRVGRFLNICVGNGYYKDKILAKESYVFFLELLGEISLCVEVYDLQKDPKHYKIRRNGDYFDFSKTKPDAPFMMLQGKGFKNQEMGSELKKALEEKFGIIHRK